VAPRLGGSTRPVAAATPDESMDGEIPLKKFSLMTFVGADGRDNRVT
jgi:hypothetical protein